MKGLFVFDVMTNIPLFLTLIVNNDTTNVMFHFTKLMSLFRIFRLSTFVVYSQRLMLRFGVDDKYLETFKMAAYWILCIHWAACLHIVPGLMASQFRYYVKVHAWYENKSFDKRDAYGKYIICLFKSVKTFMGTGYIKDMQPTTYFDKIYATLLTMFGRIALCITLAYIYEIIQGVRSASLRYDEMMVQLNIYTDQNNLPSSTKMKLKTNYEYMFRKRYFNEHEIWKTVSAPLRQQILIHNTRQLVEDSPFFKNLPTYLIMKIISVLTMELYLEGDVIYMVGQIGTSVYFITSGSVVFYTPSGKEVCHFCDGDYFGEMTLISDTEYHYSTVVALETTECYK